MRSRASRRCGPHLRHGRRARYAHTPDVSRELFAAAEQPKEFWLAPEAGRNDLGAVGAIEAAVASCAATWGRTHRRFPPGNRAAPFDDRVPVPEVRPGIYCCGESYPA